MKYGNHKTKTFDGIVHDSKKEALRWSELKFMEKAGVISNLRRQVEFELVPSQYLNGKCVERAVKYRADFVYVENGKTIVEDTKGVKTKDYIIKRKLLLYIHGIRITEI